MWPCEETALTDAVDAGKRGLIVPILVGPKATLRALAGAKDIDVGAVEIVDVGESRADSLRSRIASCALAVLAAHARRKPPE